MAKAGKSEVTNCLGCGRDTRSKCGFCARCLGTNRNSQINDQKGRPQRSTLVLGGHALEEDDEEDQTSDERYHG